MKCDEIVILYKNNKGYIETTEENIQKIIDMAYTKGFEAGKKMNYVYSGNIALNTLEPSHRLDDYITTSYTDSSHVDGIYSASTTEDTRLS
jgi:hypothetical protein